MKRIVVTILSILMISGCGNSAVKNNESDYEDGYSAENYTNEDSSTEDEEKEKKIRVKELKKLKDSSNICNAAILTDNSLWLWGGNEEGELGFGTTGNITVPTKLMDDVESIYSAYKIYAVLKTDGSLWTWGSNEGGSLGKGEVTSSATPQKVMEDVKQAKFAGSSTEAFGMALKEDNTLWVWGSNRHIYISDSEKLYRDLPIKLMDNVKDFDMEGYVIKTDNSLWRYTGEQKKLMDNVKSIHTVVGINEVQYAIKTDDSLWRVPYETESLGGTVTYHDEYLIMDGVKEILENHALKTDGSLWTFEIEIDEFGNSKISERFPPQKLMDNVLQFDIAYSKDYYIVLKTDGTVWTWGKNSYGSLGNGTSTDSETPVQVIDNVKQLYEDHGGAHHVLKNDGTLWSWGWNYYGCLGEASLSIAYEPIKIMDSVEKVFFGGNACFAEKTDGSLWSWGKNYNGILGIGTSDDLIHDPTEVSFE